MLEAVRKVFKKTFPLASGDAEFDSEIEQNQTLNNLPQSEHLVFQQYQHLADAPKWRMVIL
jgi:hypothetical protein